MTSPSVHNEFGQPIGRALTGPLPSGPPPDTAMTGSQCVVRRLDPDADRGALFAAYTAAEDDRSWTYLSDGPYADEVSFGAWLTSAGDMTDPRFFTVVDSAGPCGLASYLRITPASGSVEVGHIHFAPRLQGTTASTEAMYLMMRRAFESGYRRYEWKCDALNAPSRAAALRLGFTFEGVFRQATAYKGRNRDTAWFSVIDTEWPAIRDEFERWLEPANFDSTGAQRTPLRMAPSA